MTPSYQSINRRMPKKIYVVRTHGINVTNLFISMMVLNEHDRAYKICDYELSRDGKFFILTPGEMVNHYEETLQTEFRNIDWSENIDLLAESVEDSGDRLVIFGNHNVDSIRAIKKRFGDDVMTIGINYSNQDYYYLLRNMAEYHVWCLRNGLLTPTEHDDLTISDTELTDHYTREFERMGLIPRNSEESFDYDINFRDFMDRGRMTEHLKAIGLEPNAATLDHYDHWRSAN